MYQEGKSENVKIFIFVQNQGKSLLKALKKKKYDLRN